mgnify:CR=1 FL=1
MGVLSWMGGWLYSVPHRSTMFHKAAAKAAEDRAATALQLAARVGDERDKLARDLLPTIARSCTFWGAVQSVNFRFVPLRLQVLFSSSAYLVWQTYVSWVANRGLRRSAE